MALLVPNLQASPTFDAQAIPDATDLAAQLAAPAPTSTGVASGCGVTQQSSPNMTVQVASGSILVAGSTVAVAAVTSLTIAAADATDRKDIVVVNSSGVVSVVKGTDCGTAGWTRTTANPLTTNPPPVKPAIPASSVLLAEVYVAASTTSISAGNIIDKTTPAGILTINSSSALGITNTLTINYEPNSSTERLKGNTGFLEIQNPTMGRLPPVTGIVANGTKWTITFASSVLGTLGSVGDTFQIWTADFVPSGWNYGNSLATHTATITGTGTTVDVTNATSPAAITTYGLAYTPNIITTGLIDGPGGEFQLEGTTTFDQSISNLYGIGPAFQTQKTYTNGPVYTATWNVTNGSNSINISGDQRANVMAGLFLISGASFPLNASIATCAYNGTNTVVTLVNTLNGLAANYTGSTGTESLTFAAAVAPGEIYVGAGFLTGTQAGVPMIPNAANFAGPGAGQGWGDAISVGYAYKSVTNVMDSGIQIGPSYSSGAQGLLSVGRFQGTDAIVGPTSSLGFQLGVMPIGVLDYNIPNATIDPASDGTALSSLSTLHVQLGVVPFPTQGSAVIPASDGMHIVSWTGGTATALGSILSSATLTGCTYSGSTAATVSQGALLSCLPQFKQPKSAAPTGLYGAVQSVGFLNPASTYHPSQAPATTIASGSNNVSTLVIATGSVNSADNGTAFSGLSTLTLNASTTAFGSSGIGTIVHSGKTYVFSWTGQSGSTLTGCVFSGLQSTTVSTNDVVTAGGIIDVASLQWFPDTAGNLAIASSNLYGYFAYTATTGTSVTQGTAAALSTLSTLTVVSTAALPTAGTATLQCSDGPHTVTWTGIGSATTLTGCTYSGSTAATVITGSQLWLATVTTGPAGMAQSFLGCTVTGGTAITFGTGMQVLGLPGGTHQATTLPNQGNLMCIGPGFTLPEVVGSKMSLFAAAASTAAVLTPLFGGISPIYDGKYVELVNSRVTGGATITFTSNGTSNGTLLSLGGGTRAVGIGGMLALRWDQTILVTGGGGAYGEWVEISASNLGSHG